VRILVVNWQDRLNPQAGGAEAHLHEVFGRLAARGHSVSLLVSGFRGAAQRERIDGMEVRRVGGRMTFGARAPAGFRRAFPKQSFDVVVEDLNKVPVFTPFWVRAPVVLLVHHLFGSTAFREASLPVAAATWLLERPLPGLYRGLPLVAVSESTAQDLRGRGFPREEIAVIPNGVDLTRYSPDPRGERFPEPTVLYLGRLKRYKGVDLVLGAVARLRARGIGVRLLVAGKGDHQPELLRLRDRLGLGDSAAFLGYVDEEEKLELLRRSWLHVLASPKEGWGIAILEAAACGTPSVASDSPGLRDSVRDGVTGLLAPHGDVEALTAALSALLEDPERRRRMGESARRFAEAFTWEASAERMEAFLETRVAGPGPQR
jgi:glycosyltransferase involved in cell wall biosynthesis